MEGSGVTGLLDAEPSAPRLVELTTTVSAETQVFTETNEGRKLSPDDLAANPMERVQV